MRAVRSASAITSFAWLAERAVASRAVPRFMPFGLPERCFVLLALLVRHSFFGPLVISSMRPTGDGRKRLLFQNVFIARGSLRAIVLLDEQPVIPLFSLPAMHPNEVPAPVQLLAVELECKVTLRQAFVRIGFGLPMAAIPDHHRPAAIFTLRDRAFEFIIRDRMIFDLDSQPFFARHEARSSRHRPTFHHAIKFEPQVVVKSRGRMLLYDECVAAFAGYLAFRFGGDAKSAFGPIRL